MKKPPDPASSPLHSPLHRSQTTLSLSFEAFSVSVLAPHSDEGKFLVVVWWRRNAKDPDARSAYSRVRSELWPGRWLYLGSSSPASSVVWGDLIRFDCRRFSSSALVQFVCTRGSRSVFIERLIREWLTRSELCGVAQSIVPWPSETPQLLGILSEFYWLCGMRFCNDISTVSWAPGRELLIWVAKVNIHHNSSHSTSGVLVPLSFLVMKNSMILYAPVCFGVSISGWILQILDGTVQDTGGFNFTHCHLFSLDFAFCVLESAVLGGYYSIFEKFMNCSLLGLGVNSLLGWQGVNFRFFRWVLIGCFLGTLLGHCGRWNTIKWLVHDNYSDPSCTVLQFALIRRLNEYTVMHLYYCFLLLPSSRMLWVISNLHGNGDLYATRGSLLWVPFLPMTVVVMICNSCFLLYSLSDLYWTGSNRVMPILVLANKLQLQLSSYYAILCDELLLWPSKMEFISSLLLECATGCVVRSRVAPVVDEQPWPVTPGCILRSGTPKCSAVDEILLPLAPFKLSDGLFGWSLLSTWLIGQQGLFYSLFIFGSVCLFCILLAGYLQFHPLYDINEEMPILVISESLAVSFISCLWIVFLSYFLVHRSSLRQLLNCASGCVVGSRFAPVMVEQTWPITLGCIFQLPLWSMMKSYLTETHFPASVFFDLLPLTFLLAQLCIIEELILLKEMFVILLFTSWDHTDSNGPRWIIWMFVTSQFWLLHVSRLIAWLFVFVDLRVPITDQQTRWLHIPFADNTGRVLNQDTLIQSLEFVLQVIEVLLEDFKTIPMDSSSLADNHIFIAIAGTQALTFSTTFCKKTLLNGFCTELSCFKFFMFEIGLLTVASEYIRQFRLIILRPFYRLPTGSDCSLVHCYRTYKVTMLSIQNCSVITYVHRLFL